jgi:hypothetical protein
VELARDAASISADEVKASLDKLYKELSDATKHEKQAISEKIKFEEAKLTVISNK